MQFRVIDNFFDKHTGGYFPVGSTFETKDKSRAEELRAGGFIADEEKPARGGCPTATEQHRAGDETGTDS